MDRKTNEIQELSLFLSKRNTFAAKKEVKLVLLTSYRLKYNTHCQSLKLNPSKQQDFTKIRCHQFQAANKLWKSVLEVEQGCVFCAPLLQYEWISKQWRIRSTWTSKIIMTLLMGNQPYLLVSTFNKLAGWSLWTCDEDEMDVEISERSIGLPTSGLQRFWLLTKLFHFSSWLTGWDSERRKLNRKSLEIWKIKWKWIFFTAAFWFLILILIS